MSEGQRELCDIRLRCLGTASVILSIVFPRIQVLDSALLAFEGPAAAAQRPLSPGSTTRFLLVGPGPAFAYSFSSSSSLRST